MKAHMYVLMAILGALLWVAVDSSEAQRSRPQQSRMTTSEILTTLKPGQWVQLEGTVQPDLSVLCTSVEFLTGNFLDDDWGITGIVRKIDKSKQEIEVLNFPIKFHKNTEFQNKTGNFKNFDDLKIGMLIDMEGTYLNGAFLVKEIDNESGKLVIKPELKNEIEVLGKVEKVDAFRRTITLMGVSFQLTDETKGKSALK